jgi:hypothetical protein
MILMFHVHRMRDMQVLGACSCNEGWGGPDCSVALSEPSWPPAWFVYAAVGASTVISMVLWLASRQLLSDYIQRRRQAQEESQAMLVLLLDPGCCACTYIHTHIHTYIQSYDYMCLYDHLVACKLVKHTSACVCFHRQSMSPPFPLCCFVSTWHLV